MKVILGNLPARTNDNKRDMIKSRGKTVNNSIINQAFADSLVEFLAPVGAKFHKVGGGKGKFRSGWSYNISQ